MTKTSKTSHLKVKEIKQGIALTYISERKFSDLPKQEAIDGIVELWKNYRSLMQDNFWLKGNEKDYKGAYLEGYYKNPRWWVGIYDGDKIVGTEYFTFRGLRMFSGFLFADSVEIAKELGTQLYEQAKITHPKLETVESLHITNVDEYDISFREDIGYRAWSWIDETDKIRELQNVRISFLKKIRSEWEEQNND
jgi:hypothetical protein